MKKVAPALGLSLLSLSGAAGAQVVPERRFDIGIAVTNSYESNILRINPDAPVSPGQSRDDFRATPSITIDVQQPLGRQAVFLAGSVGYDFYRENKQLERERIELIGGADLSLGPCSSRVFLSYGRQQSDLADVLVDERQINTQTRTSYGADLGCRTFGPLEPTFSYEHERVKNDDPLRQSGNNTKDSFSVGLNYSRPAFGTVGLSTSYVYSRYDRTAAFPLENSLKAYSANIFFEREFGSQLLGTASLGVTRVDPSLPDVPDFQGLSYSADLTWSPGTRMQVAVGISREAEQPNLLSISYAIVDSYRAELRYALSNRIRLSTGVDLQRRLLRDSALTAGPVLITDDRRVLLFAGATYQAGDRLSFSLNGSAERRRSDFDELDYNNYSVALTTRLTI